MATNIDKFVEPSEIPGGTAVPIGGIIGWMNPNPAAMNPTPPAGFEFCDGTAVTTPGSLLLGEIKPNLMITSAGGMQGISRGADVNTAPYGVGTAIIQGGSDFHNHTSNAAGDHTHGMNNHTHTLGGHQHEVAAGSGTHDHGGFTSNTNHTGVAAIGPAYQGGAFYHNHAIMPTGSTHSHGNVTANSDPSDGPNNNATDLQGSHNHSVNNNVVFPVYVAYVAQIIRVL